MVFDIFHIGPAIDQSHSPAFHIIHQLTTAWADAFVIFIPLELRRFELACRNPFIPVLRASILG